MVFPKAEVADSHSKRGEGNGNKGMERKWLNGRGGEQIERR